MIEEKIEGLLEAKFQEEGFRDCFPIEVRQHNKKLEVFIDSDNGVDFGTCQQVSRYLEEHLDREGWLGPSYTLEVSSPGVSRPLKYRRQYPKHVGRRVEVKVGDETLRGILTAVAEDSITLEQKVRRKEGKRKKTEIVHREIPFSEIAQTIVQASF